MFRRQPQVKNTDSQALLSNSVFDRMQHSAEQRPVSRIGAGNDDGFHFCRHGTPEGGLALAFRGSPLFSVHGKEAPSMTDLRRSSAENSMKESHKPNEG